MAKKIILTFNANPIGGDTFTYDILIGGVPIVYSSGLTVDAVYHATGTPNSIEQATIEIQPLILTSPRPTIENTIAYLREYYISPIIQYERVFDTIEVLINTNETIDITFSDTADNIVINIEDIAEVPLNTDGMAIAGLKYFFRYTNIINDTYLCKIYKKNFTDIPIEINGTATIDKGSVKDHLDIIRGTGLALELEASTLITLEDLYTQDEQDFTVKLYKNSVLMFHGFLKPDGVYQSFVRDRWAINLDCIDGLGTLSNLSFVQSTGLHFVGKMKAIDIIYYCLKRTGISLPVNTSINILYKDLVYSDSLDILTKIKIDSNRYVKVDNDTIMSCEEVLKSILELFGAVITQESGEWYIYKANEIFNSQDILFRRYDIDNVYVGNVTLNINKVLGSQIDTYYPHHCSGNQKIEIKGSISAFRMGYKYGFVKGLLPNPTLQHNNLVYESWTVVDGTNLINDPTKKSGFVIRNTDAITTTTIVKNNNLAVIAGDALSLRFNYTNTGRGGIFYRLGSFLRLKIQCGIYYLKYYATIKTSLDNAVDTAEWVTDPTAEYQLHLLGGGEITVAIPLIKTTDNLTVSIVRTVQGNGITTINSFDVVPNTGAKPEQGEFHTVSRRTKVSTIVKENKTVYNGDNAGIVYLGAIYKEDGIEPTSLWSRKNSFESFPLLRIAAEEELRINQKPLKVFKGSVYGYIPYLCYIDINNITGGFMPTEYSYDTKANITTLKLLEIYSSELSDIDYKLTYDYGNTVKPTIVG